MTYKILSPYTPDDAVKKMLDTLRQANAKIESMSNRSFKAKIKIGFMASVSVQANLTETPYGSIIEFAIPELFEDRLVDETFFGARTATIGQMEKKEKIRLKINDLKSSVDGLDEEEARSTIGIRSSVKFLTNCKNCGSPYRKGFRCENCHHLMVEFE